VSCRRDVSCSRARRAGRSTLLVGGGLEPRVPRPCVDALDRVRDSVIRRRVRAFATLQTLRCARARCAARAGTRQCNPWSHCRKLLPHTNHELHPPRVTSRNVPRANGFLERKRPSLVFFSFTFIYRRAKYLHARASSVVPRTLARRTSSCSLRASRPRRNSRRTSLHRAIDVTSLMGRPHHSLAIVTKCKVTLLLTSCGHARRPRKPPRLCAQRSAAAPADTPATEARKVALGTGMRGVL
jgi:hypothetical protein